jgi:hypothetical protein
MEKDGQWYWNFLFCRRMSIKDLQIIWLISLGKSKPSVYDCPDRTNSCRRFLVCGWAMWILVFTRSWDVSGFSNIYSSLIFGGWMTSRFCEWDRIVSEPTNKPEHEDFRRQGESWRAEKVLKTSNDFKNLKNDRRYVCDRLKNNATNTLSELPLCRGGRFYKPMGICGQDRRCWLTLILLLAPICERDYTSFKGSQTMYWSGGCVGIPAEL